MAINTADTRFWKGTLSDGHYKCNGAVVSGKDICMNAGNTWGSDTVYIETAEFNSWTVPKGLEDTDVNDPLKRWCVPANNPLTDNKKTLNPMQCTQINCYMERKL